MSPTFPLSNAVLLTGCAAQRRFYFASQVSDQMYPVGSRALSGGAHGNIYWELANEETQGKWEVRFTQESRRVPGIA